MLIGSFALAMLALFTTMPLVWLALGVPWMTLVVTFAPIPLLDASVGGPLRSAMRALRTIPDVPQLPAGCPTVVVVAMIPPLWFALIEPRLPEAAT